MCDGWVQPVEGKHGNTPNLASFPVKEATLQEDSTSLCQLWISRICAVNVETKFKHSLVRSSNTHILTNGFVVHFLLLNPRNDCQAYIFIHIPGCTIQTGLKHPGSPSTPLDPTATPSQLAATCSPRCVEFHQATLNGHLLLCGSVEKLKCFSISQS